MRDVLFCFVFLFESCDFLEEEIEVFFDYCEGVIVIFFWKVKRGERLNVLV